MLEFAVIGYDGKDDGAMDRRMAAREGHLQCIAELCAQGRMIHGGALLDDEGKMIGSIIIATFPTRDELNAWLARDPYIIGKVWERYEVIPFKTAPSFIKNLPQQPASAV